MANVLDMLGRAALRIGGMSPQQIRQQARANKKPKPMPKPRASKPAATPPKPPAPGSTRPVGQTSLFNQSGQPRDFRNPKVAANRQPTIERAVQGPKSALKPGPIRPEAPGQMSLFGTNPGAKPGGNFRAPSVPNAGAGIRQYSQGAKDWLNSKSTEAATQRALSASRNAKNLSVGRLGGLAGILSIANAIDDARLNDAQRKEKYSVVNPNRGDNLLDRFQAGTLGQADKPKPAPTRKPNVATDGRYVEGRQQQQFRQPPAPRSPAVGAPVHASPSAFGSSQKLQQQAVSPYVGSSAATPARPSTPAQAAQQANPYAGIGDVRGNGLGQSPVPENAQYSAGTQEYGGQKLQGIDENGIDMERRRAFLDAKDSMSGMDAVRELLKRRKLSISVEN